ncbi:MFS transporter [Psittacicella hinzii]|nr:MFS transporter [Psittacicella hinzii]
MTKATTQLLQNEPTEQNNNTDNFDQVTPWQASLAKRIPPLPLLIPLLALLTICAAFVNDAFSPALQSMVHDFNTTIENMQKVISYNLIGMGIGTLIFGPFIDRYGRKTALIFCSLAGIIVNFTMIHAPNYHSLIVIRICQGIIFGGLSSTPEVMIKDIFSPRKFVIHNAWLITLFLFGPALSPLIGGYIFVWAGWHWIFYSVCIFLALGIIFILFYIPETLDPSKVQAFRPKQIAQNFKQILTTKPAVLLIIISTTLTVAVFGFPTLLPAIYLVDYHVAPDKFGYFTFSLVLLQIVGIQLNKFIMKRGLSPLKVWLAATSVQAIFTLANFVVAAKFLSVPSIIIVLGLNMLLNGFQIANMTILYLMNFPSFTGTAVSLLTFIRLVVPGLIIGWVSMLPRHMGATLLLLNAGLILICTCLAWVYYLCFSSKHISHKSN